MNQVHIHIKDDQTNFYAGDMVSGTAEVTLPEEAPLDTVVISFHCVGEVKWTDQTLRSPFHLSGHVHYSRHEYLEEVSGVKDEDVKIDSYLDLYGIKKVTIPFSFEIPKDKSLPSSMICRQGSIHYFVRVSIKDKNEIIKFIKEVIVQSPMEKNLMLTVGGSAEKSVLLHGGKVSMHASIGRKGFAPGERITAHVIVSNQTNAKVIPRISLHQVQIYMSGIRHNTIETTLGEAVTGAEIAPNQESVESILNVLIPADESLSIKSSVITVKYFIHVTLDIPHSFDLHVNLPIVVTSKRFIGELQGQKDQPGELIGKE